MRIRTFRKSPVSIILFFLTGLIAVMPYQLGNAQLSQADKEALAKKGSLGVSTDLGDPAFYRGLSEEEASRMIEFSKIINFGARRIKRNLDAEELQARLTAFVHAVFSDSARSNPWTVKEKLKLWRFQSEAEKLGLFVFESEREKQYLQEILKTPILDENDLAQIEWPIMPMKGRSVYPEDPEYPGLTELEAAKIKEWKQRIQDDSVSYSTKKAELQERQLQRLLRTTDSKGAIKESKSTNLGDPKFYRGLTQAEVDRLFRFTEILFGDTTSSPEALELKRSLERFLIESFADTARTFGWTKEEKLKLNQFRQKAQELGLLTLDTMEKRTEAWRKIKQEQRSKANKEVKVK
ncbi:MAG: hypothetical protein L0196_02370 [candidate division Zixibacteria bacterium]|nr:hypothetical protein [candidate division Zixibacteria bacterium]